MLLGPSRAHLTWLFFCFSNSTLFRASIRSNQIQSNEMHKDPPGFSSWLDAFALLSGTFSFACTPKLMRNRLKVTIRPAGLTQVDSAQNKYTNTLTRTHEEKRTSAKNTRPDKKCLSISNKLLSHHLPKVFFFF